MYLIYQITNLILVFYLFFLKVEIAFPIFYIGIVVYCIGLVICTLSIISFSKPQANGINLNGIYTISRNPMYVGYFFYYLGCGLLTQSLVYILVVLVFQIDTHFIILSEERWCLNEFGTEYRNYMDKVSRYL